MRSPVAAVLWENWRLTRQEAAHRLALATVTGAAVMVWFRTVNGTAAVSVGASNTFGLLILLTFPAWLSLGKLKGGRFLDGYRPGFPLSLLYARPVRTAALVGVSMAYQAGLAAAVYVAGALVLRWVFEYPFPLVPAAVGIAVAHSGMAAGDWATRSKAVQWIGTTAPVVAVGALAMRRWEGSAERFAFSWTDYTVMAAIALVAFGLAVAGVARQRRGDVRAGVIREAAGSGGFPEWLVGLVRLPCPTASPTQAQVWFDMTSAGLPVLAVGVALAIVNPLLFAITTAIDAAAGATYARPIAVLVALGSMPVVLFLGGNAFGIRARQGRTFAGVFDATQAYGTAGLAGIKVLVRSVCLLVALAAAGAGIWFSASVIPFDVLDDNDTLIEKSRAPLSGTMRGIDEAVRAMSAPELLALVFVAFMLIAAMVASRASLAALRTRYPRRLTVATSLLLLNGLALVALTLAGQRGLASRALVEAAAGTQAWLAATGVGLVTIYLSWRVLAERLLTMPALCAAVLVSGAFGAAWVTVLRIAGLQLAGMPVADATVWLSPVLLTLLASVLAPWSLSRIRHI